MIEAVLLAPLQVLGEMLELQYKGFETGASVIMLKFKQQVL